MEAYKKDIDRWFPPRTCG